MFEYVEALEKLSKQFGITGQESRVARTILSEIKDYIDSYEFTPLGSLIAVKRGSSEKHPKLMISTHIDEVGFVVSSILEGGFLRVNPRGGVDFKILPSKEVVIHSSEGEILAIFSIIPPHLLSEEDKKRPLNYDKLVLDTGLSEEEVKKRIKIGDPVTFKGEFLRLNGNKVSGKSFDDRSSVLVSIALLKELSYFKNVWDVYCVFSTQEEVGSQGCYTATFKINPDIGIAIDVTIGDQPDIGGSFEGYKLGEGTAIGVGPDFTPKIVKDLVNTAKEEKLNYVMEPMSRPGGTDAAVIQIVRAGIPTALLSIPLRYMHTPVEVIDIGDVKSTVKLLLSYIKRLDEKYLEELKWS